MTLKTKIETWSDKKTLKKFNQLLQRVQLSSHLVEDPEQEGVFTGQVMIIQCGDKYLESEPVYFDWPLQIMPIPDAFRGRLN